MSSGIKKEPDDNGPWAEDHEPDMSYMPQAVTYPLAANEHRAHPYNIHMDFVEFVLIKLSGRTPNDVIGTRSEINLDFTCRRAAHSYDVLRQALDDAHENPLHYDEGLVSTLNHALYLAEALAMGLISYVAEAKIVDEEGEEWKKEG